MATDCFKDNVAGCTAATGPTGFETELFGSAQTAGPTIVTGGTPEASVADKTENPFPANVPPSLMSRDLGVGFAKPSFLTTETGRSFVSRDLGFGLLGTRWNREAPGTAGVPPAFAAPSRLYRDSSWKSSSSFGTPFNEILLAQATRTVEIAQAQPLNRQDERTKLETLARTTMRGGDLRRFTDNMNAFESRAQTKGLTDQQIAETYSNIGRILSAGPAATISFNDRVKIAREIVRIAARPTANDQGHHGTCNVTVVESRVYTRNPEKAAKLVADVATTGSFVTADGFTITPNKTSFTPDDESGSQPPGDGRRGLASQIFQVTAANIKWQRTVVTPDGHVAGWGKIVYEQNPNKRSRWTKDTGERVMDYSSNPPRETTKYSQGPSLSVSDLPDISNQITGLKETDFVIESTVHGGRNTKHVSSPQDLETAITSTQPNFPLFIRVHTGNDPFLTDTAGSFTRQRGVWHVVSITGYDPRTRKVTIDNQWGSNSDKTIDLDKLYKSTMEPGTPEWKKKHEALVTPLFKGSVFDPLKF